MNRNMNQQQHNIRKKTWNKKSEMHQKEDSHMKHYLIIIQLLLG